MGLWESLAPPPVRLKRGQDNENRIAILTHSCPTAITNTLLLLLSHITKTSKILTQCAKIQQQRKIEGDFCQNFEVTTDCKNFRHFVQTKDYLTADRDSIMKKNVCRAWWSVFDRLLINVQRHIDASSKCKKSY